MKRLPVRGFIFSPILLILFAISTFAQGKFVYTNNAAFPSNTVTGFSVSAGGTLTQIAGSPFPTGGTLGGGFSGTRNIDLCMVGNFLYAANHSSLAGFAINPVTGFLTTVPGSPFPIDDDLGLGIQLACTPSGKFLFAANSATSFIFAYSINPNGSLAPVTGSPFFSGGIGPFGMRVTPDNKHLLVALSNSQSKAISVFSIGVGGVLTQVPGSPFPTSGLGLPTGLEINCAGNLVFVSEQALGITLIDVFSFSPNGTLTPITGSPFFGSSDDPFQIQLSPNQKFLFAVNGNSNRISVFNVASNGSLSEIAGSPFANTGGTLPFGLSVDAEGSLLYVANLTASVSVFNIATNGTLTPVTGSPFPTGQPGVFFSPIAYPAKSCVSAFDTCIQDDSSGSVLQVNTTTGDYQFTNCSGFTISGTGSLTKRGSTITLQHTAPDRRVMVKIDGGLNKATASIQILSQGLSFTLTDRNTADNTCSCR